MFDLRNDSRFDFNLKNNLVIQNSHVDLYHRGMKLLKFLVDDNYSLNWNKHVIIWKCSGFCRVKFKCDFTTYTTYLTRLTFLQNVFFLPLDFLILTWLWTTFKTTSSSTPTRQTTTSYRIRMERNRESFHGCWQIIHIY